MPDKVLVTREVPEAGLRVLEPFDVTVLHERPPERDELLEAVRGASGILSTATEKVDGEVMDAAGESLKVVANMAVGYDNVDVEAARERSVVVTNTPGVLDETTADVAFMLLLAAARRLGEGERLLRAGRWEWWGPKQLRGQDVWGKRLGIIGFGRIGQSVARRAKGFGMEISYHNRSRKEEAEEETDARYLDLDELLRTADLVSIHTPLTDETRHLIGAAELEKMKPDAVLVNTSRGPVVDETALADALAEGRIFAAGLDVYEDEPEVHPKLLELENAVLAPHIGSASVETRDRMATLAAENIVAVLSGEEPKTPVNVGGNPEQSNMSSVSHPLEGVRLKIARAAEHLQTLDNENKVYFEDKPYEVVHERDEERSRHVYRFHVRRPPPLRLSILMGDCLYNLRSSLDHLAWQLVLATGGAPTRQTSFPIFKDEEKFCEFKKRTRAPTGVVGGISEEAARQIEALQPYNRPDDSPEEHALWVLHTLNNIDKHRHLNLTTLGTTNTQTTLTNAAGHPIFAIQLLDHAAGAGPVKDGAEIAAFPILDDSEKRVRMESAAFVALEEMQSLAHLPIGSVVQASLDFVRDEVVPALEEFS